MNYYTVKTGELECSVRAFNHKTAAIIAINTYNPKSMGLIISVNEYSKPESEEVYMLTGSILEAMGMPLEEKQR